ncbi:hypothetical protein CEUSTIGMA_g7606.t1 [Chlamydomonas eustigma]|uniref:FAD-binding domain-containing protein n=1 Tax=Chlamydomonas eustigma TaxID=1157962 RepID=A0A250XAR2_9CHLO|nr:hypothetical protein CEUSTIGMA_g7606.t1 [Chlamydomonas eustigma]|eukprot:GAX80168.1 hypothetical protein CEUSTIGMA_g7606.t1 [Chlamydomonas eustigma]
MMAQIRKAGQIHSRPSNVVRAQSNISGALVIGGGPAGLALSLMLQRRGWTDITVLEKLPLDFDDSTKSYVYAIDGRGRKFTDLFGLTDNVKDASVEMSSLKVLTVPVQGHAKSSSLQIKDSSKQVYWLPRKNFLNVLQQRVDAMPPGSIKLHHNSSCTAITRNEAGAIQVSAVVDGMPHKFETRLLVGADGINSLVRQTLVQWDHSGRFDMHSVDSPSAGLKYKIMTLPPNPTVSKDGSVMVPNSTMGIIQGSGDLRIGLLPVKDQRSNRTGNFILRPENPFWNLSSKEELYDALEANFPQLPVRELISEEAAEAFVTGSGGRFPQPQHCSAMYMLLEDSCLGERTSWDESRTAFTFNGEDSQASRSGDRPPSSQLNPHPASHHASSAAVLLVGDAVHCFPPDLGQGVNSALEDVFVLDQVLDKCEGDLYKALPMYEELRMPDVKALISIMQFGYPYQYNQDKLGKALWTANFIVRLGLNKALPALIAPPTFLMVQDAMLSYRRILELEEETMMWIKVMIGAVVAGVLVVLLTLLIQ